VKSSSLLAFSIKIARKILICFNCFRENYIFVPNILGIKVKQKSSRMKKMIKALALAMLLMVAIPSQAQIKFGIKAGINLAKADFSNLSQNVKAENFTGYFLGPMMEVTVPVVGLALDGALLYSHSGMKFEDPRHGFRNETMNRNTIEIPVNLKYKFGFSSMIGAYLALGPQWGFNLSTDDFLDDDGSLTFKKSTLSMNIGAGLNFLSHFQVGLNYNIPLGKTAEFESATEVATALFKGSSSKNKTWQITAAYIF
jgi:hypothetical protein